MDQTYGYRVTLNVVSVVLLCYSIILLCGTLMLAIMGMNTGPMQTLQINSEGAITNIDFMTLGVAAFVALTAALDFATGVLGLVAAMNKKVVGAFFIVNIIAIIVAILCIGVTVFQMNSLDWIAVLINVIILAFSLWLSFNTKRKLDAGTLEADTSQLGLYDHAAGFFSTLMIVIGAVLVGTAGIDFAIGPSLRSEADLYFSGTGFLVIDFNLMILLACGWMAITGILLIVSGILGRNAARNPKVAPPFFGFSIATTCTGVLGIFTTAAQVGAMDWLITTAAVTISCCAVWLAWKIMEKSGIVPTTNPGVQDPQI